MAPPPTCALRGFSIFYKIAYVTRSPPLLLFSFPFSFESIITVSFLNQNFNFVIIKSEGKYLVVSFKKIMFSPVRINDIHYHLLFEKFKRQRIQHLAYQTLVF